MIDTETLKAHLRLDPDETIEDALLDEYEAAAVAYVERYTGRYFGPPAERVDYLEGTGAREMWLSEEPTGVVVVVSDEVEVEAEDFTVRGRRLRHASAWGLSAYPTDVVATYSAGYAAGEEPADIRVAVMELVGKMYKYRTPIVTDAVSAEIPHGVRDTLNRWRRIPV
jgi:hypothetical protein